MDLGKFRFVVIAFVSSLNYSLDNKYAGIKNARQALHARILNSSAKKANNQCQEHIAYTLMILSLCLTETVHANMKKWLKIEYVAVLILKGIKTSLG